MPQSASSVTGSVFRKLKHCSLIIGYWDTTKEGTCCFNIQQAYSKAMSHINCRILSRDNDINTQKPLNQWESSTWQKITAACQYTNHISWCPMWVDSSNMKAIQEVVNKIMVRNFMTNQRLTFGGKWLEHYGTEIKSEALLSEFTVQTSKQYHEWLERKRSESNWANTLTHFWTDRCISFQESLPSNSCMCQQADLWYSHGSNGFCCTDFNRYTLLLCTKYHRE